MRQVAVLAVVVLLGFSLVGCVSRPGLICKGADTPESVMGEMISTMKDLNGELAKIKTADDLKAAEGKLKQLGERMKDIKERGDKLGMENLPKEQQEALEAKFKGTMETVMKDMMGNMMRLGMLAQSDPEAKKVFDSFGDIMK
jgi:hypothetical protein